MHHRPHPARAAAITAEKHAVFRAGLEGFCATANALTEAWLPASEESQLAAVAYAEALDTTGDTYIPKRPLVLKGLSMGVQVRPSWIP